MDWNHVPANLQEARQHLPDLIRQVERRAPYAHALISRNSGLQITVTDREQQVKEMEPSSGLVLSAWNGAYFDELATSDLSKASLDTLARDLSSGLNVRSPVGLDPGPALDQHWSTAMQHDPTNLSVKDKLALCLDLHRRTRGLDPHIVNVQVRYQERCESKAFANRSRHLSQNVLRLRLFVLVVVTDGARIQYDWVDKDGTGGLEVVSISDQELHDLCTKAVASLAADKIPPCVYQVVTCPDVSGVIAHEAFGHGVELDMFLKDRARSREYLNRAVASPLVSILDDPSYPGGHGTYFFDDEGQIASPTCIIRDGVFRQGLSDLFTSHRLGMPHTANGRRESFERKNYVRMSNTFFARGTTPVAELFSGIDYGIYLNKTSSGMEDPKGWGMQVTSQCGEEIRQGKLTGRLFAPIGITGYVPDILQSVSAVGNDFRLTGGTCGKGHKEWVPVSSGGPHLLLKARLG